MSQNNNDRFKVNITLSAAVILSILILGGKGLMIMQSMQDMDKALIMLIDDVRSDSDKGMHSLNMEIENLSRRVSDNERSIIISNTRHSMSQQPGAHSASGPPKDDQPKK